MKVKRIVPGSFAMELTLWVLFFPIGFVYSVWRHTHVTYETEP